MVKSTLVHPKNKITKQYRLLADIWNSEAWRGHASLIAYMNSAYDLDLDENEAEFYSPDLVEDWRDSSGQS